MSDIIDLWPELKVEKIRSPRTILKEQADLLGKKTNNILLGEVEFRNYESSEFSYNNSTEDDGYIYFSFKVKAPNFGGYTYTLFSGRYNAIGFYPILIYGKEVNNEKDFLSLIKEKFNSPDTLRIINALYSQSIDEDN